MFYVTCYFCYWHWHEIQSHQLGNPFFGTDSRGLFTSGSDYASAQWRLALHILVICSPHVKYWVARAICGIHWGWSHWPITIQHLRVRWGSVLSWRACLTGSEKATRVSRSIGNFLNGLKNICKFWSMIKMHDLLMCNIIKMMPYNGCPQMLRISLKTEKSFSSNDVPDFHTTQTMKWSEVRCTRQWSLSGHQHVCIIYSKEDIKRQLKKT